MSLIVGFYENDIFCEINEFLVKSFEGLAKFQCDDENGHLAQMVIVR